MDSTQAITRNVGFLCSQPYNCASGRSQKHTNALNVAIIIRHVFVGGNVCVSFSFTDKNKSRLPSLLREQDATVTGVSAGFRAHKGRYGCVVGQEWRLNFLYVTTPKTRTTPKRPILILGHIIYSCGSSSPECNVLQPRCQQLK